MELTLLGLERIAGPVRAAVPPYTRMIIETFGSSAKALTFFGAAVSVGFEVHRHSAYNVLVLSEVDLTRLRKLTELGVKLGKAHIAAPWVMTPEYIQASRDTFALELIEIQQHHVTVFGEEYFRDLVFQDGHVRLQCERELKVSLITLRHGLLAAAGREKELEQVQVDVGESLARALRGMLWLKGHKEAKPAAEVLSEVEKITERKLDGLRTALNLHTRHGWEEFEGLHRDVEALKKIVDAW